MLVTISISNTRHVFATRSFSGRSQTLRRFRFFARRFRFCVDEILGNGWFAHLTRQKSKFAGLLYGQCFRFVFDGVAIIGMIFLSRRRFVNGLCLCAPCGDSEHEQKQEFPHVVLLKYSQI